MFNFDNKDLVCFKKVAETEHMTRAAQELYISQAQLSRIISDLENQFEVKFFDRVGKGIRLNACGRYFYNYTQQIFDLTYNARRKVKEIYLHEQSQVTILANCSSYMPGALKELSGAAPDLKLRQMSVTAKKCVSLLKEGVADFAICCPMIEDSELKSTLLRREPGIVIYPKGHWLETRSHVSLRELADEAFIGQSRGYATREACELGFEKYDFEPNYIIEMPETNLIAKMVDESLGISVVPKSQFEHDSVFGSRYASIDEHMFAPVGLTWRRDRILSETDQLVIDNMIAYFNSLSKSV